MTDLVDHPSGGYRFLPGDEPYSAGAAAAPGYRLLRLAVDPPLPWRQGMERVREWLWKQGRPVDALCGVELRSPAPFTRQGFLDFNRPYRELLADWGLLVEGVNPIARTNVAPAVSPPAVEVLVAATVAMPAGDSQEGGFVVAGAGELRGGPLLDAPVVRPSGTDPDAVDEKARYVLRVMSRRLQGLGAGWEQVTGVRVYTMLDLEAVRPALLEVAGPAAGEGFTWVPSRPPIDELAFEMDCRRVLSEQRLASM